MHAFVNELNELNIYDQLQSAIDTNPQENYDTFIKLLSSAKNKHLPKRIVRFNKKKHKKAKWLTNGILNSINTKDKMYKKLMKADNLDEVMYANLKAEFNDYKRHYVVVLMKLSNCITRGPLNCIEMILNRRGL